MRNSGLAVKHMARRLARKALPPSAITH